MGDAVHRSNGPPRALRGALVDVVGPTRVHSGDEASAWDRDWTGGWAARALAVVCPGSAAQVAGVVRVCADRGIGLVPRGGNTGLVGGAAADADQVLLDVTRLRSLAPIRADGTVLAGAGATVGDLQRHAAAARWRYPVDFASRDSATVGGTVATNAGGIHVMRHGPTRAQLRGIEIVRGDGALVSDLRGLCKDNTGPSLAAAVCGSEGTYGVVTAALVQLVRRARHRSVAMIGLPTVAQAAAAVAGLRAITEIEAVELVDAASIAAMTPTLGRPPVHTGSGSRSAVMLLVEAVLPPDDLAGRLAPVLDCSHAVIGEGARADELWRWRDGITAALAVAGPVAKFDVSLPLDTWSDLLALLDAAIAGGPLGSGRRHAFGHAVDGNLHLNVVGRDPQLPSLDEVVYRAVIDLGGSVSAEHGIGRAKRRWLAEQRSPAELDTMARLRAAWDPHGICNPRAARP